MRSDDRAGLATFAAYWTTTSGRFWTCPADRFGWCHGRMTMTGEDLTHVRRHPERAGSGRSELYAILDATLIGTLSTTVDGLPWAVPMLYARIGDTIVLHGSTGAGALRHVASGAPACFSVARLDALVVADTLFEHSANYRSAVIRGRLQPQSGDAHRDALRAMSERLLPGRPDEVPEMTRKELAATSSVSLPIEDGCWTTKVRTGPPAPPETDKDAWCGVVPLHEVWGEPVPAEWQDGSTPLPRSVVSLSS